MGSGPSSGPSTGGLVCPEGPPGAPAILGASKLSSVRASRAFLHKPPQASRFQACPGTSTARLASRGLYRFRRPLQTPRGAWRPLEAPGGPWRPLEAPGGPWRPLEARLQRASKILLIQETEIKLVLHFQFR